VPRVKLTRTSRLALILLRIYLIAVLVLLVLRFTHLGH
jgi:hypothetical protein